MKRPSRIFLSLSLLAISLAISTSATVYGDDSLKEELSPEDIEIINNLEMLSDFELFSDWDLYDNYDIFIDTTVE